MSEFDEAAGIFLAIRLNAASLMALERVARAQGKDRKAMARELLEYMLGDEQFVAMMLEADEVEVPARRSGDEG